MKSVDFTDRLLSIATVNKFGRPNGLGFITCGVSLLADDNGMAGIYQNRRYGNKKSIVRMRHYVPTNRQLENQQIWRAYFATVLLSWQNLSQSEKDIWNKKSFPAHMTGWNRYASYHLKAHDI